MTRAHPHWAHQSTHFTLVEREQGDQYQVCTGELVCDQCKAAALHVERVDELTPSALNWGLARAGPELVP